MKEVIERVLGHARNEQATDIHFLSTEQKILVQVRSNEGLYAVDELGESEYDRFVQYMRYWCALPETDTRIPQSGIYTHEDIEIRVTFLPSASKTFMSWRLPSLTRELVQLMSAGDVKAFRQIAKLKNGLFLIGGATGAGKTTVLYALLEQMSNRRVVTIENPPEQVLSGVIQLEVKPQAGLDYKRLLKETLRADPDVIVIGEVRTEEEFHVAYEAALSGHLTIATFHTSSIVEGESRLARYMDRIQVTRHWCVLNRDTEVTCEWSTYR